MTSCDPVAAGTVPSDPRGPGSGKESKDRGVRMGRACPAGSPFPPFGFQKAGLPFREWKSCFIRVTNLS